MHCDWRLWAVARSFSLDHKYSFGRFSLHWARRRLIKYLVGIDFTDWNIPMFWFVLRCFGTVCLAWRFSTWQHVLIRAILQHKATLSLGVRHRCPVSYHWAYVSESLIVLKVFYWAFISVNRVLSNCGQSMHLNLLIGRKISVVTKCLGRPWLFYFRRKRELVVDHRLRYTASRDCVVAWVARDARVLFLLGDLAHTNA